MHLIGQFGHDDLGTSIVAAVKSQQDYHVQLRYEAETVVRLSFVCTQQTALDLWFICLESLKSRIIKICHSICHYHIVELAVVTTLMVVSCYVSGKRAVYSSPLQSTLLVNTGNKQQSCLKTIV